MTIINDTNGFRAIHALRKVALDPRIDEIEGAALDEGRVFIHLKAGWLFDGYNGHSKSVGSASELRDAMRLVVPS